MHKIIILSLLFIPFTLVAQEKKILQLLNDAVKKQTTYQYSSDHFGNDTIRVVKPFSITKDKQLQFTFRQYNTDNNTWTIVSQSVPLQKIVTLDKDVTILFRTGDDKEVAIQTTYTVDGKQIVDNNKQDVFILLRFTAPNNEKFGQQLLKAFQKAGYPIEIEFWAD